MALPVPPERKENSNHDHVVQVAVGSQHALLLTDEGIVYSWGVSGNLAGQGRGQTYGQLGRVTLNSDKEREPSPVTDLQNHIIVQIACGANHCLALSQDGKLFAWGSNKAGQLGQEKFDMYSKAPLLERSPKPIRIPPSFTRQDEEFVRSCSCGPESSACVTMKGEVYVWGATSFYLFSDGQRYDQDSEENCTVPVKVRGVQDKYISSRIADQVSDVFTSAQVSLYRRSFACTLGRETAAEDLYSLISSLKSRSSTLSALVRSKRQNRNDPSSADDEIEVEEIKALKDDFKRERNRCAEDLQRFEENRNTCRSDLARINRDLTVCDQQDTSFTDWARHLEARKSEPSGQGSLNKKTLETQLSDVQYFKDSNKKTRLKLLQERDTLEQEMLKLDRALTQVSSQKTAVEGRMKLFGQLQRGGTVKAGNASIDDGLDIAMSKRDELAATEPQTLANSSKRFAGVREILAISERALQDVSSALKEINSASTGSEGGAIVEALEANLKLRKEHASLVLEKLTCAERGRPAKAPFLESKGMLSFFNEASKDYHSGSQLLL